MSQRRY